MIEREYAAVDEIVKNADMPDGTRELFLRLPYLPGGAGVIKTAGKLTNNASALGALSEIAEVYDILRGYGIEKYITINLSMAGQLDYYTGIIFEGYVHKSGFSVLNGGRYDDLLSKFGRGCPAVGFAIGISRLVSAVFADNPVRAARADTLVAYSKKGRASALATADELRMGGLHIENSLAGEDIGANVEYARVKGINGVLYFHDENRVTLHDMTTGISRDVSIRDLLNGQKPEEK